MEASAEALGMSSADIVETVLRWVLQALIQVVFLFFISLRRNIAQIVVVFCKSWNSSLS